MARSITTKRVQVHQECSCGFNSVYPEQVRLTVKQLKAAGMRYKKDVKTGQRFFLQHVKLECDGTGHWEDNEDY